MLLAAGVRRNKAGQRSPRQTTSQRERASAQLAARHPLRCALSPPRASPRSAAHACISFPVSASRLPPLVFCAHCAVWPDARPRVPRLRPTRSARARFHDGSSARAALAGHSRRREPGRARRGRVVRLCVTQGTGATGLQSGGRRSERPRRDCAQGTDDVPSDDTERGRTL